MKNLFKILVLIVLISAPVFASPFIIGIVNDANDETAANDYIITLWNPANGINDNLTDVIGSNGNSGAANIYMIDCDLLDTPCLIGDTINTKVFNNGSNYLTDIASLVISGEGFDVMDNLTINSPPNVSLISPNNGTSLSNGSVNFSCTSYDLDSNLDNVTLYGNWSGGWHANQTNNINGLTNTSLFSVDLDEGFYKWSCFVYDNLTIGNFADDNYTFSVDFSSPNVSSIYLNLTGDVCGISEIVRVNCTASDLVTEIDQVIIQSNGPTNNTNYSTVLLTGDTYYADIFLNDVGTWTFTCFANDSAGNIENITSNDFIQIRSGAADLYVNSSEIYFSENSPIELQDVVINATIYNDGCSDADDFYIGFYDGDPDIDGVQINGNISSSIGNISNGVVNVSWPADIGLSNIFVVADVASNISEYNETNNKGNRSIEILAWQEFYGNITISKLVGNSNYKNLSLWYNESSLSGNVFITDTESNIDWQSLYSIGKNTSGGNTTNDFSEIDDFLNMTTFSDSVSDTFTIDGNTPKGIADFFVHKSNILQVPIINSTNNTNFITGILWDSSDSIDSEYGGGVDKEDLLFVTKVNGGSIGAYGIYDYEIQIPVRLREYDVADSNDVFIYFDIN